MKLTGWRPTRRPIGIALGNQCVHLMQVTGKPGSSLDASRAVIASAPCGHLDDGEALTHAIRTALQAESFQGKQAVIALPAPAIRSKAVRLPTMPPAELDAAAKYEANDRSYQREDNPAQSAYINAGTIRHGQERKQEIILLHSDLNLIETLLQAAVQAGLQPMAIEPTQTAVARAGWWTALPIGDKAQAEPDTSVAYLLRTDAWAEVIFARGCRVQLIKHLTVTDPAANDQPKLTLAQVNDEEPASQASPGRAYTAIGREIALCLRYVNVSFTGNPPQQLHVLGGLSDSGRVGLKSSLSLNPAAWEATAWPGGITPWDTTPSDPEIMANVVAMGLSLRLDEPGHVHEEAA